MDTRLLKMFCAVAESGSLGQAAAKLRLTPSAISHGIKDLESQMDCRLFDRVGKKLLLNQAGEQLLSLARAPLAQLEAASAAVKRFARSGSTRLRLGAAASACGYFLPRVIRELKQAHPNLELQIDSGTTEAMVDLVRANQVDLVLGLAPHTTTGLDTRPVFRDELMFMFAPMHPWAAGRGLTAEVLSRQPLIVFQRSSLTTRRVLDHYQSLGATPAAVMEIASFEGIKELVKLDLGVSVLAPWTADKELLRGTLKTRPLAAKPLMRDWVIISLATRRFSTEEELFCRLCRNQATGLRLDRRDVPALKE